MAFNTFIMNPLMLMTDALIHWNSKYHKPKSFLHLKPVIQFECDKDPILNQYNLPDTKWDVIEHMAVFLKLFNVAAKKFSASEYPTFVDVIPVYEWLMARLEAVSISIF